MCLFLRRTHWLSSDSIVTSVLSLYVISTSLFNNFHVSCSSTCPLPSRQLFLIPFSPSFCFILLTFIFGAVPPPVGGGGISPCNECIFPHTHNWWDPHSCEWEEVYTRNKVYFLVFGSLRRQFLSFWVVLSITFLLFTWHICRVQDISPPPLVPFLMQYCDLVPSVSCN